MGPPRAGLSGGALVAVPRSSQRVAARSGSRLFPGELRCAGERIPPASAAAPPAEQRCCKPAALRAHWCEGAAFGYTTSGGGRMVEGEKERLPGQDPAPNGATAAEIERLRDELAGARGQLAATSEVLAVIGRSASDLEGVLETVVESARNLCHADAGQVFLVDEDRYRFSYGSGMTREYREFIANNPVMLDRG